MVFASSKDKRFLTKNGLIVAQMKNKRIVSMIAEGSLP